MQRGKPPFSQKNKSANHSVSLKCTVHWARGVPFFYQFKNKHFAARISASRIFYTYNLWNEKQPQRLLCFHPPLVFISFYLLAVIRSFGKMKIKTVRFDVVSIFGIKSQMILCTDMRSNDRRKIIPSPKLLILWFGQWIWNSNGWIYVNSVNKRHLFCLLYHITDKWCETNCNDFTLFIASMMWYSCSSFALLSNSKAISIYSRARNDKGMVFSLFI